MFCCVTARNEQCEKRRRALPAPAVSRWENKLPRFMVKIQECRACVVFHLLCSATTPHPDSISRCPLRFTYCLLSPLINTSRPLGPNAHSHSQTHLKRCTNLNSNGAKSSLPHTHTYTHAYHSTVILVCLPVILTKYSAVVFFLHLELI